MSMTKEELDTKVAETTPAEPPAKRTKVAILGFTDSWKLAPFNDPEYEIWGLNELYLFIPRWDRWFEVHDRRIYEQDRGRTHEHILRLRQMTCPIYMHQHWDDIPASVAYPLQAVTQAFPNPCPEALAYLTNSISYMLALSLLEGFEEIGIYGVDMSHSSEYCLAPETRVLTADLHWIPLSDVHIGQTLLAFDEEVPVHRGELRTAEFRKYRKAVVEDVQCLTRPCYRLTMADGTILVSSAGHRWLTMSAHSRNWLETEKLQPAEVYPSHRSKIVKLTPVWNEDRSWDAGYLAAAFDGEGHLSQTQRDNCTSTCTTLGFSQKLNGMSIQVMQSMSRLQFHFGAVSVQDGREKYTVKGNRAEVLRVLGSVRPRRLMEKFDADRVGCLNSIDDVPVLKKEFIGEQAVIGLRTSTRTFIAEGFASHNSQQRPSCEYYIGIAQGRGVKVYIPSESDLLKTVFLYGYQQMQAMAFDRKLQDMERGTQERFNAASQQLQQVVEQRAQYAGALQQITHWRTNWRSDHSSS